MENLKSKKSSEDVYSSLTKDGRDLNSDVIEDLPRFRHSRRSETIFRACKGAAFLFLTCALLYCYASLCNLSYEVQMLRERMGRMERNNVATFSADRSKTEFAVQTDQDEPDEPFLIQGLRFDEDDDSSTTSLKRKREISLWREWTTERSKESKESYTSSRSTASEEYSSEPLDNVETTSPRSRKHRKHLRIPKKFHRHHVPVEKYFAELESTTAMPIHNRQSRTKQTTGFGLGKHKRVLEHKPLLQVYGSKDYITLEEALRRPASLMTINSDMPPERGRRPKPGSSELVYQSSSKEYSESTAYNMIMVHYAADTSHYSRERDSNYCGNGRMQMKESLYKDWKAAHSTHGVDISRYFSLNRGEVTVSITGIYLIYAQVQYSNLQEVNGYEIIRNRHTVAQCITTSDHHDKHEIRSNTCDTSTTILLNAGDRVYIQDLHHGRHVVLKPEKSYFGLILLSPFKEKKFN